MREPIITIEIGREGAKFYEHSHLANVELGLSAEQSEKLLEVAAQAVKEVFQVCVNHHDFFAEINAEI